MKPSRVKKEKVAFSVRIRREAFLQANKARLAMKKTWPETIEELFKEFSKLKGTT